MRAFELSLPLQSSREGTQLVADPYERREDSNEAPGVKCNVGIRKARRFISATGPGLTGMALSLGIGFPGVIFPITIAMRDFLKLLAGLIEPGEGFWTAFDGSRLAAARTVRHLIASDDFQQVGDQLLLLLAGTGLRDSNAELANRINGTFETQAFQRHVVDGA